VVNVFFNFYDDLKKMPIATQAQKSQIGFQQKLTFFSPKCAKSCQKIVSVHNIDPIKDHNVGQVSFFVYVRPAAVFETDVLLLDNQS
jgi:hypothetical protein